MKVWVNDPAVFRKPTLGSMDTTFPINVIVDNGDGTVVGTIDEDRLTTVKRVILSERLYDEWYEPQYINLDTFY